jgi:beta-glucosidase
MTRSDPDGFKELTKYLYNRYKLPIFCTESGFAVMSENSLPLLDALDDKDRVEYYRGVLEAMLDAMHEDGVVVKAYFPWSTRSLPNPMKPWISDFWVILH